MPCISTSTSARRTASARRAEPLGRSAGDQLAALGVLSPSSTAARIAAAQSPPAAAEQARDRLAQLAGAERLVGEERELPAVERLAELAVVVGEREPLAQVGGELRAKLVETCRLAARLGRRDRQQRCDRSGRKSSRSKTTGPAAIAPAVARRSAVTASASSAAASGGSDSSGASSRRSSRTSSRSTSRPNSGGISPRASGQSCEISPVAAGRKLMPPPSSASRPRRGRRPARARHRCAPCRRACARDRRRRASNASSCQSKPPQRSAVHVSIGSRIDAEERVVARLAEPGVCAGEDRGSRLAPQVVDRVARVGQPPRGRRLLLDEAADERAVLVERRPSGRVLLERERDLRAALGGERRRGRTRAATRRDAGRAAREPTRRAAAPPCLAARAPVRDAVVVALPPRRDRRRRSAGTAARRGGTPPCGRGRRRATRASARPPTRAPGGDRPRDTSREPRHGESCALPQRLRQPHVPDPGDERLVEQRLAERARPRRRRAGAQHRVELAAALEDVRAEPARARGRAARARARSRARLRPRRRAGRATGCRRAALRAAAPTSGRHPQVGAEDDAAVEAESRFLPIASTDSSGGRRAARRPARACARGFGDSASICSPTSTWSRRAARCNVSPSGTFPP